jgi:septal ring factor EnvC (AmiA/AmiB activator)
MQIELNEKRDVISNTLEKNAKLELQILDLERQLKEFKQRVFDVENTNNELNSLKNDMVNKTEEFIKNKHELESEKCRRFVRSSVYSLFISQVSSSHILFL